MGTSNLKYFNNRFQGSLSVQQCQALEALIQLRENDGCIPDIVHSIYQLTDETIEWLIDYYAQTGMMPTEEYTKPLGTLEGYQTISVASMYYVGNGILGDSVGLGKTVEVCGLFNLLKREAKDHDFRFLVLTEKKSAPQVRSELIKFTGEYVDLLRNAEQKHIKKFLENHPCDYELDCSITSTHSLMKCPAFVSWMQMYTDGFDHPPFDILVVDESSVVGGSTSGYTESLRAIMKFFKRIIFLNATPVESNVSVFYTQLDLLDKTYLPTKANFKKEYYVMKYGGMYARETGKYKNTDKFKELIKYRYFASTRRSIGAEMSGCSGGIIRSDLSPCQKKLLKEVTMHRMVYDCPCMLDSSIPFDEENVPKLGSLRGLLEDECADALSVLLFVYYKESQRYMSEWLHKMGYSNRVLNGETSPKDSDAIIGDFKNGEYKVLITNVQKALNFGNCDYCIFYSIEPNPSKMVQFEGRMTRSLDVIGKHVYILSSRGKEYNMLNTVVRSRATAMRDMTEVDYSVVLSVLLGGEY